MKKRIILSSLVLLLSIAFMTYRYHVYQERYDMVKFAEFSDEVDHLTKVVSDEVYTKKVNSLEKNYLKSLYSCDTKDRNDALNVIIDADNKRYEIIRERIKRDYEYKILLLNSKY